MDGLVKDFRYAFRALLRQPIISIMVVLTIALGIGATTAIFSLLDAIALRELPVKDPSGLVAIHLLNKNHESESLPLSAFEIIKSRQTAFKAFAGWTSLGVTTESNGTLTPSILDGVMGGYFSLLRIQPALGRFIQTYDDGSAGGPVSAVTVISYHFWQEWYNKDQKVIGKSIVVQGIPFTIVGVAPKDYLGLQVGVPTDLTVPLPMIQKVANAVNMGVTQPQMDYALGRLNPKVGIVQARAQMASLWQRIQATSGSQNYTPRQISNIYTSRIITESASTGFSSLRGQVSNSLTILLLISGSVLILACANLASYMIARGASRSYEMGLRIAFGASRWRLVRQVLTESMVLSSVGLILGIMFAFVGSHLLAGMLTQMYSVRSALDITPDFRVLTFSAVAAIITGILIGSGPAWFATRRDPRSALQDGPRTVVHGKSLLGKILVVTQVALALVILESAGIFLGNLVQIHQASFGFRTHGVLEVELLPRPGGYEKLDDISYYRALLEKLSSLPGIGSSSMSNFTPGSGGQSPVSVAHSSSIDGNRITADRAWVAPGFFRTMGMHLPDGRDFTWQDNAESQHVAIVSEGLARKLFPSGNAVDQDIRIGDDRNLSNVRIVGIANDARLSDVRQVQPFSVFLPSMQGGKSVMEFPVVELATAETSAGITVPVSRSVESLGHEFVMSISPVDAIINLFLTRERMTAMVSSFFALLALLLAVIGLFALISYTVARRTHEIAIRLALGASPASAQHLIMRETIWLLVSGIAIGGPCALLASRIAASLVVGTVPVPLAVLAPACCLLLLAGIVAGYVPARRATRVDPVASLRQDR